MFAMELAMITQLHVMANAKVLIFICVILVINVIAIGIIVTMKNIVMMLQMKVVPVQQGIVISIARF